jgi:3-oxoacyl-[acyl-carrier protein] reductase
MELVTKIKKIRSAIKYGGYNEIHVTRIEDKKKLLGKNILITGGSSGIGFQIARKCCECGASVVITGRNEKKLIQATEAIKGNIQYYVWDLEDINGVQQKVADINNIFHGDLNCLVNNAGVQPSEFFPNVSEKEWERIYDTNSKGLFFLSQEVSKLWVKDKKKEYRKIINIDSQGGFVGATYPYRMVKWDIRGLTQGLGLKLAKEGILVNAIAPGVVKTDMQHFAMIQGENTYCDQNPLHRVSLPEEVAELAAFMLSDACCFMVGQTIVIDGGYSIK